ncbi:lamin tail domain-containing protein [Nocardioides mangrovi]|uniref:Lamin tail domain-containing protein n=1 Tax=Nocardioides mangrovi TaxID=2874580 RepID=A0ABS7U6R4_9ACTN|nr:lamin tail domain-containing protein [Nocardioides mangrovi]MBZ5736673.1 lamin tail domain-containing protein [Nocardioides mangrovi]
MRRLRSSLSAVLAVALSTAALWVVVPTADAATGAVITITEYAYGGKASGAGGTDGEYVELTNVGDAAQDLTGWKYDNSAATFSTALSLSGLGTVAPGESVIITDLTAAEFRTEWGLKDTVKVLSNGKTHTLNGGPNAVHIYNSGGTDVDTVSYASGYFTGGKGQAVAGSTSTSFAFETVGDGEGSWASVGGSVGSPGASTLGTTTPTDVRTSTGGGGTPTTDPNYADIVINEVTSNNSGNGFAPLDADDLIELYNKGTHDVSLSGWKQTDSNANGFAAATDFSTGLYVDGTLATTIPAGGYGVFSSGPGLSSGGDAVKVYTPDGTLVDSLTYTAGQAGVDETINTSGYYKSLASCPDGSDTLKEVPTATFGTTNGACTGGVTPLTSDPEAPCSTENSGTASGTLPSGLVTWPGSPSPATIDDECAWVTAESGQDLSGLAFDPSDANVLYAVKNKSHVYRLVRSGSTWVKDTANSWGSGKDLRFQGNTGLPDSEGLTVGPDGMLYITTERDNSASGVPLDSILRFDPSASGTTLVATEQWVLTSDLDFTNADANLGFEGVTYVPDSFLTGYGFRTDDGTLYDPADYPDKALPGLFLGAVEKTGHLRAYVLDTDGTWARVADIATGMVGVMDASYDADLGRIWAHCDNTCGNATTLLEIGSDGHVAVDRSYSTPADLPNYNLEGFAVAPMSTATDGSREVLWSDDGNRFGHSLWSGTIDVELDLDQTATPTPTIVGSPTVGQTLTASVGTWDPGVTTHYVWKDGSTVLATDGPLVLGDSLVGHAVTLEVTGTRAGFAAATASATATVAAAELDGPAARIVGTPELGQTLTADVGSWESGVTTHYVWKDGDGVLATDAPLTLSDPALVGRTITLAVTGSKPGYTPHTSTVTAVVRAATLDAPEPTISGSPQVGRTLTASATWGPGSVDLTYAWFADGAPISGADGTTLVLGAGQVGATITVAVTGTKTGYATRTVSSDPTAPVERGTISSKRPTIKGKAKVGRTLTAVPGRWSAGGAPVTLTYKWFADGSAIKGATTSELGLTKKLKGARITVRVTGSAAGFEKAAETSKATSKVR